MCRSAPGICPSAGRCALWPSARRRIDGSLSPRRPSRSRSSRGQRQPGAESAERPELIGSRQPGRRCRAERTAGSRADVTGRSGRAAAPGWRRRRAAAGAGRCSWYWPPRPRCHCGSSGPIRHSRMRRSICGPGTWNGPVGCTMCRSRTFPRISPGRPSSTRRSALSRTASAVWPPRAFSRCASCSGLRACCGPRPSGCTGSGRRCWPRRCLPPWPARSSWALSRLSTRWRCSCFPSRYGWASDRRTANSGPG